MARPGINFLSILGGPVGSGAGSASTDTSGRPSASGLKPGTSASLFNVTAGGGVIETVTVDAQGKATFTIVKQPGQSYVIDGTARLDAGPGQIVAPAAPTMTLTPGNGQVSIAWTDGATGGSAITSHGLYRGTSSGNLQLVGFIITGSPYVDTGLTNGTPYIYQLSAKNGAGESIRTAEAGATPTAGTGVIADPNRYVFGSTRTTLPTLIAIPADGQLSSLTKIGFTTPDFPVTEMRPVFPNFAVDGGGGSVQELDPASILTVDGAVITIGTTTYPLTFGGASSTTIPIGGTLIADPLTFGTPVPARTKCFAIQSVSTPSGGTRPAGMARQTQNGEAMELTASPQLAKLTATASIATAGNMTGTNNATAYGPSTVVVKGWDGRPVVLIVGDSMIAAAIDVSLNCPPSGVSGFGARGLDSTANGAIRYPHLNLGLTGSRASQCSTRNAGQFQRRAQMLDAIRALNATQGKTGTDGKGLPPFTAILSEHINNDTGSTAGNTGTGLLAVLQTWWNFLRTEFPAAIIVQTTAMPNSQSTDGSKWTTLAGQTLSTANDYPTTGPVNANMRWFASNSFRDNPPAPLVAVINTAQFLVDPTEKGKWKLQAFATTMAADNAANATSVSLAASPDIGSLLVVEV